MERRVDMLVALFREFEYVFGLHGEVYDHQLRPKGCAPELVIRDLEANELASSSSSKDQAGRKAITVSRFEFEFLLSNCIINVCFLQEMAQISKHATPLQLLTLPHHPSSNPKAKANNCSQSSKTRLQASGKPKYKTTSTISIKSTIVSRINPSITSLKSSS
jgi:hypothetical protein